MRFFVALWLFFVPLFAATTVDSHTTIQELLYQFDLESSFADHPYFDEAKARDFYSDREFLAVVARGAEFIPTIKAVLKSEGIPEGFAYMPVIESEFKSRARSHAGAHGIWQLVPQTARNFGLKVTKKVDERRDPIKSTYAIARYLTHLHKTFGKWYLAVMAYSCGEGKLMKAIKQAGTDRVTVLLDEEAKYLPRETREHFKKLMTVALQAGNDRLQESIALRAPAIATAPRLVSIHVQTGRSLAQVAQQVGMSVAHLRRLNPHLSTKQIKGTLRYSLNLPSTKAELVR